MEENEEIITASAAFDIPTDNYEEFDEQIDPEKLNERIIQKNPLKGSIREFQIYDNNYLLLKVKKKKITKSYRVNLAWVSADPVHDKIIIWKWLYFMLTAISLAILCLFFAFVKDFYTNYSIIGGIVFLTVSVIMGLLFLYHMRDNYKFYSRFGMAELFILENKRPDQVNFDRFMLKIQHTIDLLHRKLPVHDRLVGELKMCRRLRDENIIDDRTYTAARTVIFKHEQYQSQ